ncbi:CPBP family intramembrane glutamic endopeptidase [Paenibacillus hodogayensis]|uniref:CPBP family intramembrane glutamic endopeptidase n=1 Tax=Paenibacillus hodogayensis TaxID=279208 RepID=A0ABV5W228_9BACL
MTTLYLWFILIGICIPGIGLMTRYTANELLAKPDNRMSERALRIALAAQTFILVALAAGAGLYFGPKVGLTDRFLAGLSQGRTEWADLYRQLLSGTVGGVVCTAVWVACYYGFIRSRIDRASLLIAEQARNELGLAARIASGGITEEILFRWGLLSIAMWSVSLLTSQTTAFWISIVVTGILFGLAHLPGYIAKGCIPSPLLVGSTVLGNLWVSFFCGYMFWQYGLIAAIVVHALFHVIWYPWDRAAFIRLSRAG